MGEAFEIHLILSQAGFFGNIPVRLYLVDITGGTATDLALTAKSDFIISVGTPDAIPVNITDEMVTDPNVTVTSICE